MLSTPRKTPGRPAEVRLRDWREVYEPFSPSRWNGRRTAGGPVHALRHPVLAQPRPTGRVGQRAGFGVSSPPMLIAKPTVTPEEGAGPDGQVTAMAPNTHGSPGDHDGRQPVQGSCDLRK